VTVTVRAVRVFDPVDAFLADRGLDGAHPRPVGPIRLLVFRQELRVRTNHQGFLVFYGRVTAADGIARLLDLTGTVRIRVESDAYAPAEFDVTIPGAEPATLALQPGPAYPFPMATPLPRGHGGTGTAAAAVASVRSGPHLPPVPVAPALLRGTVADESGPVPDATVAAPGASGVLTNHSGQWVLVFGEPAPETATVEVTLPDGRTGRTGDVPLRGTAALTVTIPRSPDA
jgi:hypothetical protein